MDPGEALDDLRVVRRILERTHRRVDPHMFHFLIWGGIVLVWYPLLNALELAGRMDLHVPISVAALGAGAAASAVLGARAVARPRLKAANTQLANQCAALVGIFVGSGLFLSVALPHAQPAAGRFIPHVWGFLYAFMTLSLGVVYSREFLWSGLVIFAAGIVALWVPSYAGLILGIPMGLGLIVPGAIAERRVGRMMRETVDEGI